MKIKLFGCEIYISFLFISVLTIMVYIDKTGYILPVLFSSLLHEMGHLFTMWILGAAPQKIRVIPASIQIVNTHRTDYKNDIIIALSGPAFNFLFFFVFYVNFLNFKNDLSFFLSALNLFIGAYNLLPLIGLDGGSALFSFLCYKKDYIFAKNVLKLITIFSSIVILALAIIVNIKSGLNISFYIIAIYLFLFAIIKI